MNKFLKSELKGMRYYLLGLGGLLVILGLYAAMGLKISGSTSTEKWTPDGKESHGNSHFYHK